MSAPLYRIYRRNGGQLVVQNASARWIIANWKDLTDRFGPLKLGSNG